MGQGSNSNKREIRIGETRVMNCGVEATIVEYISCEDIDVQFKDGTIVQHRAYVQFLRGKIAHPGRNTETKYSNVGAEKIMSCGQKAKIIGYRSCNDIDVEFEDGTQVFHKQMTCFRNGTIANPNIPVAKCQLPTT